MRIAPVLATMLFGLFCSGALALDDTPTYAPHPQVRAEDGRAAIRPAAAGAGAIGAVTVATPKRELRPVAAPRPIAAIPGAGSRHFRAASGSRAIRFYYRKTKLEIAITLFIACAHLFGAFDLDLR